MIEFMEQAPLALVLALALLFLMLIVAPAVVLETTPVMTVEPEPLRVRLRARVPSCARATEPENVTALPGATVLTRVKAPVITWTGLGKPIL